MTEPTIWLDGALWRPGDRGPHPRNLGYLSGLGCYETLKVVDGQPFAWRLHLSRLAAGLSRLGATERAVSQVLAELGDALPGLLAAAPIAASRFGRLRITVTADGGAGGVPGGAPDRAAVDATGWLTSASLTAESTPPTSAAAITLPWRVNLDSPLVGLKCTSAAMQRLALTAAHQANAVDALLANTAGQLCEGAASNVFVVPVGGRELVTPPLSAGCLPGVTRALAIAWGRAAGLSIEERDLTFPDIAPEVSAIGGMALTSSVRGVQPVIRLGGRALPASELVGELRAAFAARAVLDPDPEPEMYAKWAWRQRPAV